MTHSNEYDIYFYMTSAGDINYYWIEPTDVQFVHGGALEAEYRLMEADVRYVMATCTVTITG